MVQMVPKPSQQTKAVDDIMYFVDYIDNNEGSKFVEGVKAGHFDHRRPSNCDKYASK